MNKQSVILRRRTLPSGRESLYLSVYRHGVREYEYLHLFIEPGEGKAIKEKNRQTMLLAETIRAKRLVEVQNDEYGLHKHVPVPLVQYVQRIADGKKESSRKRYNAMLNLLKGYVKVSMMVEDVTAKWFMGFMAYVEKQGLATNTVAVYLATLRFCINQAYREGLLQSNPVAAVKCSGWEETERTYLTADEVRRLAQTPCKSEVTKRGFLFGCLTGIRHCDITRLTWGDVHDQGGRTRIIFRQAKTKGQEYLDINAQAATLMGERGAADERVFPMPPENTFRRALFQWAEDAGITKHVTFHASRHTFAVMMLELGTDIYTVSKLLGHREITTTQVYARLLDRAKQEAVDKIPNIL